MNKLTPKIAFRAAQRVASEERPISCLTGQILLTGDEIVRLFEVLSKDYAAQPAQSTEISFASWFGDQVEAGTLDALDRDCARFVWENMPTAEPGVIADSESSFLTLLRPVMEAKRAMSDRGIPFAQFKDMFPKFLEAYDTVPVMRSQAPSAVVLDDERAALRIDSGAAMKVAERLGFPLDKNTLNFARAIVKRADELQARAASPQPVAQTENKDAKN